MTIESLFEKIGVSKTEAAVYVELLKKPRQNGSQLSSILDIKKPSVYLALEKLNQRGFVFLEQGDSKAYIAKEPQTLIAELKDQFLQSTDILLEELVKIEPIIDLNIYLSIAGRQNILLKLKEMINKAEKELYINTNFKVSLFEKEIRDALDRGVRIIAFSFTDINDLALPIEFYYNKGLGDIFATEENIIMVTDNNWALFAANRDQTELNGVFSNNPFLVNILSDHIHNDIYLLQIQEKYSVDWKELNKLRTLKESAFHQHKCQLANING